MSLLICYFFGFITDTLITRDINVFIKGFYCFGLRAGDLRRSPPTASFWLTRCKAFVWKQRRDCAQTRQDTGLGMAEYESCFTATVTRHIRMTRHHRHVQTSVGCCQFIGKFSEEASILLEVAGSELSGSHGRRLEHGYGLLHVSRVHMDPEEEIICLAFFFKL